MTAREHVHDDQWFNSAPLPPLSIYEKPATCPSRWCARCQEYRRLGDPNYGHKFPRKEMSTEKQLAEAERVTGVE